MCSDRARDWLTLRPWQRHSLAVSTAGMIYIVIGILDIIAPTNSDGVWMAERIMPLAAWGCVWITAGLAAITSARWPTWSDTWGYVALTSLAAAWSAIFLVSAIRLQEPSVLGGTLAWGLVAFIWWVISGLRNPVTDLTTSTPPVDHLAEHDAEHQDPQ